MNRFKSIASKVSKIQNMETSLYICKNKVQINFMHP